MKKTIFISTLMTALLLSGCDDFLEPEENNTFPQDQLYTAQYWEGILLNAYDFLPVNMSFNEDLLSDDAVTNDLGSPYISIATGNLSAANYPHGKWNLAFEKLHYINLFLEHVDEVTWSYESEERNLYHIQRLKGEAYGLRAFLEFSLLKYHAGITYNGELAGYPIIRNTLSPDDNWKLPRNALGECLDSIYADCERAITALPDNYQDLEFSEDVDPDYVIDYNKTFGLRFSNRINATIVKALRSRIALFAASPAYNPDADENRWQDAAAYAAGVMEMYNGIDQLTPESLTFYLKQEADEVAGVIDPEIIWKSKYSTHRILETSNYPPSLYGSGRINPSQNLVDAFPMENGYPITMDTATSKFDPENPWENRDPRLSTYILFNEGTLEGETILTLADSSLDGVGVLETSTRSGYYLKKFMNEKVQIDPNRSMTSADHFAIYLRYTEILLNYAEAVNELYGPEGSVGSQPTAREVIGAIRARAGITQPDDYLAGISSQEAFRNLVRNERRIELCFENHRYWDIRRWKEMNPLTVPVRGTYLDADTLIAYKEIEERKYQEYMIYGPIPYNEVIKYDELIQNSGY